MNSLRKRLGPVFEREVNDGILLLNMEADQIHQLNATASFIWRQCDGVALPADIAASLAREYGVEEGIAARDVEMTLNKLRTLNLVVEASTNTWEGGSPGEMV